MRGEDRAEGKQRTPREERALWQKVERDWKCLLQEAKKSKLPTLLPISFGQNNMATLKQRFQPQTFFCLPFCPTAESASSSQPASQRQRLRASLLFLSLPFPPFFTHSLRS